MHTSFANEGVLIMSNIFPADSAEYGTFDVFVLFLTEIGPLSLSFLILFKFKGPFVSLT